MDLQVWNVQKNHMGMPFDPARDVVYFSYAVNPSTLIDFEAQYPIEASKIRTIALPRTISPDNSSRHDILAALHFFEQLTEVIIVLGITRSETGSRVGTDSWEGGLFTGRDRWTFPRSVEESLEKLKKERWPDWKLPVVTIVNSQEDIMRR